MTPDSRPPSTVRALRQRLEEAAGDLVYSSESDRPFEVVSFAAPRPAAIGPLTVGELTAVVGAPPGARVAEWELDRFFARHIELTDPFDAQTQAIRPRYEALKAALRSALRDVRVFRVGEVEVRCYVVGWAPDGSIAGLATTAVET